MRGRLSSGEVCDTDMMKLLQFRKMCYAATLLQFSMTKTVTFIFTCNPPCLLDEKNYAIQVVKSAQTTINLVQSKVVQVLVGKFILLANTRNLP